MQSVCNNLHCLHNDNCVCRMSDNSVSKKGMCNNMIILDEEFNHKVYKFMIYNGEKSDKL